MLLPDIDSLCVFDLETTGTDIENDRIVTAYVGLMGRDGLIRASKSWLLNPGVEIPEGAAAVHGITTERAQAEGTDAKAGIEAIAKLLEGRIDRGTPIVAYNGSFDFTMLDRESRRHGGPGFPVAEGFTVIDPYVIDKAVDKWRRGKRKLVVTAAHYGITLSEDDAHDAEADATATGRLAWAVLDRLPNHINTTEDLHEEQALWAREQRLSLQQYLRSDKNPNGADPSIVIDPRWPVVPFGEPLGEAA